MDNKIKNYRDLNVWKSSIKLFKDIYKITANFPREELYCLVKQMRRAAISIPSNIAEGFNRYHNKEYRQFLYISLGSSAELETQISISKDLNYLNTNEESMLLEKLDHIGRKTKNLIKKL